MTERPLLFSQWKVQRIHDGATQTRRPVKEKPPSPAYSLEWYGDPPDSPVGGVGWYWLDGWVTVGPVRCPFGVPGDLLVPLTAWSVDALYDCCKPLELPKCQPTWSHWSGNKQPSHHGRLRPGRFMPLFLRGQLPRLLVERVWAESPWENNPWVWGCEVEMKA